MIFQPGSTFIIMNISIIETANIPTIGTKRLIKPVKETFAKEGITAANTTMLIKPLIFTFAS